MLSVAVPKGRVLQEVNQLFLKSGLIKQEIIEDRKLIIEYPEINMKFILSKPMDVPVYVKYGVADIGIAGKDVLLEAEEKILELLDLKIGYCRLSLCGKANSKIDFGKMPKIATKYPKTAGRYFRSKGQQVEIIKLNGSIEIAPVLGLTDFIVDIVSTGTTLRENGLTEIEKIEEISSRIIANEASFYLRNEEINQFMNSLKKVL